MTLIMEDFVNIEDTGIQLLLRQVEKNVLCVALTGCNDTIRKIFLGNMGDLAAKMVEEDIQALRLQSADKVQTAQEQILDTLKVLIDNGEIVLSETIIEREQIDIEFKEILPSVIDKVLELAKFAVKRPTAALPVCEEIVELLQSEDDAMKSEWSKLVATETDEDEESAFVFEEDLDDDIDD